MSKGSRDRTLGIDKGSLPYYENTQDKFKEYNSNLDFKFSIGDIVCYDDGIIDSVRKLIFRGDIYGDELPNFPDPGPRYLLKDSGHLFKEAGLLAASMYRHV